MLDYCVYPHIVELVLAMCDFDGLLAFRRTSHLFRRKADKRLFSHVAVLAASDIAELRQPNAPFRRLPLHLNAATAPHFTSAPLENMRVLDSYAGVSRHSNYSDKVLEALLKARSRIKVVRSRGKFIHLLVNTEIAILYNPVSFASWPVTGASRVIVHFVHPTVTNFRELAMALGMHSVHVPEVVAVFHLDASEPPAARAETTHEGLEALATGLATTLRDRIPNILIVGLEGSPPSGASASDNLLSLPSPTSSSTEAGSEAEALAVNGSSTTRETMSENDDPAAKIIMSIRQLKAMGINVKCDIDQLAAQLSFMPLAEWEARKGDMVEYEVTPELPMPEKLWMGREASSMDTEAGGVAPV